MRQEIASDLAVRAGEWDLLTDDELEVSVEQNVKTIILHEKYDTTLAANDIALLILKKPFELTDHINVICLPPQGFNFEGNTCTITGWGNLYY